MKGNPGFNPDLMVMDLVKLRASSVYKSMIHELKISLLLKKYSMHLEEDLPDLGEILNLIAAEKPQMFHKLSCEWNKSANQGMNMKNWLMMIRLKQIMFSRKNNIHTKVNYILTFFTILSQLVFILCQSH